LTTSKYHLNFLIIAHIEIVKKKTWVTIMITWYSKVGKKFLVVRRNKVWRLGAWLRIFQECLNAPANQVEFLVNLPINCLNIKLYLWMCDVPYLHMIWVEEIETWILV
jgi:hypothetical protein